MSQPLHPSPPPCGQNQAPVRSLSAGVENAAAPGWTDPSRMAADAATTAGKVASEQLPQALRHVVWEGAAAVFARAPGLWGEAIECFATPALARVLLVCLEDIPPQHRLRAIRLVGAVLGEEAVPMLLARVAMITLIPHRQSIVSRIVAASGSTLS